MSDSKTKIQWAAKCFCFKQLSYTLIITYNVINWPIIWIADVRDVCSDQTGHQEINYVSTKIKLPSHKASAKLFPWGSRFDVTSIISASAHLVVSLLAVVRLVASLVAGIRVLLIGSLLAVGIGCGRLALRRRSPHEGSDDARLLKDEPEVSNPQDQVNETKCLQEEKLRVITSFSVTKFRFW